MRFRLNPLPFSRIPALSHMQTQEWAAQILGYRNWHELSKSVGPAVERPES